MIYLKLFLEFLKIGAFTFGGGYAAVPLIRETVLSNGWMDDAMLSDMIAVSESTPGPIMVNMATYIGSSQGGLPGAAIATAAVVLPAFLFVLVLMKVMKRAMTNAGFRSAMGTLKPCIAGIILSTGAFMALKNVIGPVQAPVPDIKALILTAFLAVVWFASKKLFKNGISPILLIVIAGAAGIAVRNLF
ncbi:MAG: chromate transporter [Clostridia bacterium]|nr:chromate transporter [Clostridia bacterium]